MQYLTQIVIVVLLLWNVTVSKSASTASRDYLSSLGDTSEDDLSEDNSRTSHRDLSRPQSPASGSLSSSSSSSASSSSPWRGLEGSEGSDDHGSSSSSSKQQQQAHDIYGNTVGFFAHDGMIGGSDKFRPPPPRLYSIGGVGHRQSTVLGDNSHFVVGGGGVGHHHQQLQQQQQQHDDDGETMEGEDHMNNNNNNNNNLDQQQHQDPRILREHLQNIISRTAREDSINEDIRKHFLANPATTTTRFFIPQTRTSFIVPPAGGIRTSKRSASCLRKCMAMGFLHPSQCHSLC